MNGKPSIASDLPGVRQPVLRHKMGRLIPIGCADGLAQAVIEIWNEKKEQQSDPEELREQYSPDSIAAQYEALFNEITAEKENTSD